MKYNPYVNEFAPKGEQAMILVKGRTVTPVQQDVQVNTGNAHNNTPVQTVTNVGQPLAINQLSSQVSGRAMDVIDKSGTKLEGLIADVVGTFPNPRQLPFALFMNLFKNIALAPMEFTRYAGNDMTTAMGIKNTVNVR